MANINYTTRTEGQSKVHTVIWTVPNYLNILEKKVMREIRTNKCDNVPTNYSTKLQHNANREIRTNKCDNVTEPRFLIKMQFLGHNDDIIELSYLYPAAVFLKAILTVCLRRFEERSIVIKDYHTVQANKWQYLTTLFKRDIEGSDGTGDAFILSDGSLRLKFQFYVTSDIKVQYSSNVPAPQLCNDLESLLKEGLFSDVVMKSCDGTAFNVHKAVLASRSVVLKAHFEHNTTECQTNIIECALETEVLKEVLNFIYSDKADKLDEIPERLLAAADYYQLTRLKSLCEEALHKKLTVDNAIETLHLADLHSASNLKQLTLEFIKDGQAKLITKTSGWANLKSVELIKAIYEYIMEDDTDADII